MILGFLNYVRLLSTYVEKVLQEPLFQCFTVSFCIVFAKVFDTEVFVKTSTHVIYVIQSPHA